MQHPSLPYAQAAANNVSEVLAKFEQRLAQLEYQNEQLQRQLGVLQRRAHFVFLQEIPPNIKRSIFNRIIRAQAAEFPENFSQSIRNCYITVYDEFRRTYGVNLRVRAKNRKLSVVKYAEQALYLDELINMAIRMFEITPEKFWQIFDEDQRNTQSIETNEHFAGEHIEIHHH